MGEARWEQYTVFKKTAVLSQKLLTYGLSSLYYMFGQDNPHISYGPESPLQHAANSLRCLIALLDLLS